MSILLFSLATGSGHVRAAKALEEQCSLSYPKTPVRTLELSDVLPATIGKPLLKSYGLLAKELPALWGFMYEKTDTRVASDILDTITRLTRGIPTKKLATTLEHEAPTDIICTHFLPARLLRDLREDSGASWSLSLVMTDYDEHSLLTITGLDRYFVATDKMKDKLVRKGIESERIVVSGIPVSPEFSRVVGPPRDHITQVLVLAGGQGLGHPEGFIGEITHAYPDVTFVAVAGTNESLRRTLVSLELENLTVHGWIENMPDLMETADVIITKPGGLTVSECVAMRRPILAIYPIPGQEERNVEFILEQGYGKFAASSDDLSYYLSLTPGTLAPGYENTPQRDVPAAMCILRSIIDSDVRDN